MFLGLCTRATRERRGAISLSTSQAISLRHYASYSMRAGEDYRLAVLKICDETWHRGVRNLH